MSEFLKVSKIITVINNYCLNLVFLSSHVVAVVAHVLALLILEALVALHNALLELAELVLEQVSEVAGHLVQLLLQLADLGVLLLNHFLLGRLQLLNVLLELTLHFVLALDTVLLLSDRLEQALLHFTVGQCHRLDHFAGVSLMFIHAGSHRLLALKNLVLLLGGAVLTLLLHDELLLETINVRFEDAVHFGLIGSLVVTALSFRCLLFGCHFCFKLLIIIMSQPDQQSAAI